MAGRRNRQVRIKRTRDVKIEPNTRGLIPYTARSVIAVSHNGNQPPSSPPVPGQIDPGIRQAVKILREHNIETCESCEGGLGHAYPEPTVAFFGKARGWLAALAICLAY